MCTSVALQSYISEITDKNNNTFPPHLVSNAIKYSLLNTRSIDSNEHHSAVLIQNNRTTVKSIDFGYSKVLKVLKCN